MRDRQAFALDSTIFVSSSGVDDHSAVLRQGLNQTASCGSQFETILQGKDARNASCRIFTDVLAHNMTFADEVFFTNSGTEAIECALKTARKYHWANGAAERIDIIGFDGSFHGRSYAAVNASGNASYLEGFGPRCPATSSCRSAIMTPCTRRSGRHRGDHHRAGAGRGRGAGAERGQLPNCARSATSTACS